MQYSHTHSAKKELCTTEDHLYTNCKVWKLAPDDAVNSEKPWGGGGISCHPWKLGAVFIRVPCRWSTNHAVQPEPPLLLLSRECVHFHRFTVGVQYICFTQCRYLICKHFPDYLFKPLQRFYLFFIVIYHHKQYVMLHVAVYRGGDIIMKIECNPIQ